MTVDEIELLSTRYGASRLSIATRSFSTQTRPGLTGTIASAGCRAIFHGIDSGAQSVLNRAQKHPDLRAALAVLRLSPEYFEQTEASFIWGYPLETYADFQQTLELRAEVVDDLVRRAPHIYSGFYTFPMPAKARNHRGLASVMRALVDKTAGSTLFDTRVRIYSTTRTGPQSHGCSKQLRERPGGSGLVLDSIYSVAPAGNGRADQAIVA